jgi:F420H(2)-dependent quinone reductase
VELASGTYKVTAREAQGTEREDFLDRFRQSSPYFADFEQATEREIPVVVLDRTQRPAQLPALPAGRDEPDQYGGKSWADRDVPRCQRPVPRPVDRLLSQKSA